MDTTAVVVECRIGDVASRVIEGHARGDTLFLPAGALLALAGLDSTGAAGERPLAATSELLHADVSFDPNALIVEFADSGALPVSRRAARARARAALRERQLASRVPGTAATVARLPSAFTMGYSAEQKGAIATNLALRAFGGTLELMLGHEWRARTNAEVAWTRVPASATSGTRVRFGAIGELAGAPGILITNAPVQRDDSLGASTIRDVAQPGSEIELFDDGVLVAADSVGSRRATQLHLPQRYGTHVIRLVTHDSAGGARELRWVESSPDALLPDGTFRYVVAAGRCARAPCAGMYVSGAYAIDDRVTAGLTLAPSRRTSGRAASAVSATVDARVGTASTLSLRRHGVEGTVAELRVARDAGHALVIRSDAAPASAPSLLPPLRSGVSRRLTTAAMSWDVPRGGTVTVVGGATRSGGGVASSASIPLTVGVVQGSAAVARQASGSDCADWSMGALVTGAWLPRIFARVRAALLRVRAARRSGRCGTTSSTDAMLVLPLSALSVLELAASWDRARRTNRPAVALTVRHRVGGVMNARAELTGSGAGGIRSGVSGTLVVDLLRRGISAGADPGGATAGVHGLVYVDDNANGRIDPGEPRVDGAVVRAGEASAISDARGVFVLSQLPPDRRSRLSVDSLSVEDAGFVPRQPVDVVVTAQTVTRVDLAVRRRQVGGG